MSDGLAATTFRFGDLREWLPSDGTVELAACEWLLLHAHRRRCIENEIKAAAAHWLVERYRVDDAPVASFKEEHAALFLAAAMDDPAASEWVPEWLGKVVAGRDGDRVLMRTADGALEYVIRETISTDKLLEIVAKAGNDPWPETETSKEDSPE